MATDIPVIGILMLDCAHSDIPGCAGSDDTYPFKVKRRVVKGATVERMTSDSHELRASVLDAAQSLQSEGVDAILGDCGFIARFQKDLQQALDVPVLGSSLLLVPLIAGLIPLGKRIGILTYNAGTLGEPHFQGVGWSSKEFSVAVAGVQDQSAWQILSEPEHPYLYEDLERQLLDVCRGLLDNHPDIGALLLECTVMPPFAKKLQIELGLPVFDITLLATLMADSLSRKSFGRKPESAHNAES